MGSEHAHHGLVHSHGDHAHHAYRGIRKRIEAAALGDEVKRRALDIFDRVAVREPAAPRSWRKSRARWAF